MAENIYIYGLTDPRDNRIFYVGKSDNPERRYIQHLRDKSNPEKHRWINELKAAGLVPGQVILDVTTPEDWQQIEQEWIDYGKGAGWPLVNIAPGGGGQLSYSEKLNDCIERYQSLGYFGEDAQNLPDDEKLDLLTKAALKGIEEMREVSKRWLAEVTNGE